MDGRDADGGPAPHAGEADVQDLEPAQLAAPDAVVDELMVALEFFPGGAHDLGNYQRGLFRAILGSDLKDLS